MEYLEEDKLNSKLFSASMVKGETYTFNMNVAATFFFIRTNQPNSYSGVVYVDVFGTLGNAQGINVKVENNKISITNTIDLVRFCVGVIK